MAILVIDKIETIMSGNKTNSDQLHWHQPPLLGYAGSTVAMEVCKLLVQCNPGVDTLARLVVGS